MPTPTYTPLATKTLTGTAATVTFSSISQLYRDLCLVVSGTRSTAGGNTIVVRLNGDSANYSNIMLEGSGAAASSVIAGSNYLYGSWNNNTLGNSTVGVTTFNILNFSSTTLHKVSLARANDASTATTLVAGRWAATAAVTSVAVSLGDATLFATGSTFTLYGIAA